METPKEYKPIVASILRDAGFVARIADGELMVGSSDLPVSVSEVLKVLNCSGGVPFDAEQVGIEVRVK